MSRRSPQTLPPRWREQNPDKDKDKARSKRHDERRKINSPKKVMARAGVYKAISGGDLIRPDHCPKCGEYGKIQAHHNDYDHPLDVEWLCTRCHMQTHNGNN